MFGQADRDRLVEGRRQQFLDRPRRLQARRLDSDHPAVARDAPLQTGFGDGHVGVTGGERGFRLGDVGSGHLADLEAVAGLLQLNLENLDVVAPQAEHRRVAQHVHEGLRARLERRQFGQPQLFARHQDRGFRLIDRIGGAHAVEQGLVHLRLAGDRHAGELLLARLAEQTRNIGDLIVQRALRLRLGHPARLGLGHGFVRRADRGALLVDVGVIQIGARQGVGHGLGHDRTRSESEGRQRRADKR